MKQTAVKSLKESPARKKEPLKKVEETKKPHRKTEVESEKAQFICAHPDCGRAFETEPQLQGHQLHHIQKRGKSKKGVNKK